MAKLSDYYKSESKYLRADDIREHVELRLTIDHVAIEHIERDGEPVQTKCVCYFAGKDKGLVLNRTNATKLSDAFGDDMDAMKGKEVLLYRDIVGFRGENVPCLRLRIPAVETSPDDIPF